jgi:hypothetical protein
MIKWFAEVVCDATDYDRAGPCDEKSEATLTLKAARSIHIDLPDGWRVRYRGNDDSQRDTSSVDLDGDDIQVLCPKHKNERY